MITVSNIKKPVLFILLTLIIGYLGIGVAYGENTGLKDAFLNYRPDLPAVIPGNRAGEDGPSLTADAAALMEAGTGQLLYAKNPHQPRPIASTTKIMTALLAIECGDLKGIATVSPNAAGVEGSSIYLRSGEKITLEDLLYGALMHSGNDACVAIAENIAGREEIFVAWMNHKARLLGLKNTNFSNTNGLPAKDHLSSAYDLAVLARTALENPLFSKMVASKGHIISGPGGRRSLVNTNQLLWGYQGADGVKTGTTSAAGQCLVSSASRDGRRLIAVVLHSGNRYADSVKLLSYGFSQFEKRTVIRGGEPLARVVVPDGVRELVSAGCDRDLSVVVPVKRAGGLIEKVATVDGEIDAPVKYGVEVGKVQVFVDGSPVAEARLVTLENADRLPALKLLGRKVRKKIFPVGDTPLTAAGF